MIVLSHDIPEVKIPEYVIPQGIFIPRNHHYNANNKRKKGKNK